MACPELLRRADVKGLARRTGATRELSQSAFLLFYACRASLLTEVLK